VVFADLGLWHGRVQGSRVVGENVKDIFKRFEGRFVTIFSDGKDVVCHDIHHDGTNEYIYRIAADRDEAEQLVYEVAYKGMDLEGFKSRTKSLHEAIKNVYGWD
jgi:formamidopyrimidine-DNA glycosylase